MKNSVVLEALGSVLALAQKIIPDMAGLKENQQLVADARQVFGTHVISSRMNRLVSRSMENLYCLFVGKMFYEGTAVEADFEKSASFFQCAINYGNTKAFAYLGRQYGLGLGMIQDEIKAVELFMKGAELEDPERLYEMGACFENGWGVEKDEIMSGEFGSCAWSEERGILFSCGNGHGG